VGCADIPITGNNSKGRCYASQDQTAPPITLVLPLVPGDQQDQAPNPADYGVTLSGWSDANAAIVMDEVAMAAQRLLDAYEAYCGQSMYCPYLGDAAALFQAVFGSLSISYSINHEWTPCDVAHGTIADMTCGALAGYALDNLMKHQITHELGHLFNRAIGGIGVSELHDSTITTSLGIFVSGMLNGSYVRGRGGPEHAGGYACNHMPCVQHSWADAMGLTADEDYADMFMNWAWDSFAPSPDVMVHARYQWMDNRMGAWIYTASNRR
jgi:hypothetical protein